MKLASTAAVVVTACRAAFADAAPYMDFANLTSSDSYNVGSLTTPDYADDANSDGERGLSAPVPALVPGPAPATVSGGKGGKGGKPGQSPNQNDNGQTTDTEPNVNNGGVNLYPYTSEIRDYIVDQHNFARATMVPQEAANMRQLKWNEALAIEASELVETCVFEHDTENYAYGQNLMLGNPVIDKPTVESWMKAWVQDEISDSDRAGQGYMDLDHASAVLWAKSYYVGCASKLCPTGYLTACNYYTPGNWQGEQAFVPGPACSQCPSQAQFCDAEYGKLCTADSSGSPKQVATPPPEVPKPVPAPDPMPSKTEPKPTPSTLSPTPKPTPATPKPTPATPKPTPATPKPTPAATGSTPKPGSGNGATAPAPTPAKTGSSPGPSTPGTAPSGGCPFPVSDGDAAAGIQLVGDSSCASGGLGCFKDVCRFCKLRDTPQSKHLMPCSDLGQPQSPGASTAASPSTPSSLSSPSAGQSPSSPSAGTPSTGPDQKPTPAPSSPSGSGPKPTPAPSSPTSSGQKPTSPSSPSAGTTPSSPSAGTTPSSPSAGTPPTAQKPTPAPSSPNGSGPKPTPAPSSPASATSTPGQKSSSSTPSGATPAAPTPVDPGQKPTPAPSGLTPTAQKPTPAPSKVRL